MGNATELGKANEGNGLGPANDSVGREATNSGPEMGDPIAIIRWPSDQETELVVRGTAPQSRQVQL